VTGQTGPAWPNAARPPRGQQPQTKILKFTPFRNTAGTMRGFVVAETPSGLVIHGLKVMVGPRGKRWIAPPDAKRRGRNDEVMLDANGKAVWDPVIEFRDRDTRDRFNAMILDALRRDHPELFDEEGGQ
jgi:hypothetical protein